MFSDLECDYINPIDLCNKLNQVRPLCQVMPCPSQAIITDLVLIPPLQFTLPEMGVHGGLTLLFLLSGQWLSFLFNAPLVAYNVKR